MLIDFSINNYRSLKDTQTLSLEASASKYKSDNTFEIELKGEKVIRLLKTAVIYGANASGKSNVLKAFHIAVDLILNSNKKNLGAPINSYDPFQFDINTINQPTTFTFQFIINNIRYNYLVKYNDKNILEEVLNYYPNGNKHNLFERIGKEENYHLVKLGDSFENKRISKKVIHNRLYLTSASNEYAHEQLGEIYLYFKNFVVQNVVGEKQIDELVKKYGNIIALRKNIDFNEKINNLLRVADTGINKVSAPLEPIFKNQDGKTDGLFQNFVKTDIVTSHNVYDSNNKVRECELNINEESTGTKILFALGGLIIKKIDQGGVLLFDELDNSLHPKLCRFLIRLFQHPSSNTTNAQLIFATHEVSLLDKKTFRKDQIWFTDKNKYGATELYSAFDIEGVRDDIPFDKWYMSGKFGGQPNIKELQYIFNNG